MAINLDHVTEQITVTDTGANASLTVNPKGTGAFNVAAGANGLNLSNGGTITAFARTALGTYTSNPSVAISAPTTAGGVQATGTAIIQNNSATIAGGGTGYTVGDTVTLVGGTLATGGAGTFRVASVSGGVITSVDTSNFAQYSVAPTNPVSVTGGTGSGATLTVSYIFGYIVSSNAGSGYVEQPTVTFSGGGGSGAAAFATVGSGARLTSIGSALELATPNGIGFRVANSGVTNVNYYSAQGNSSGGAVTLLATGTDTDINSALTSKGTGSIRFQTNATAQEQMRVSHTASAVNYVQVTGSSTGNDPTLSVQGSDTNINFAFVSKGSSIYTFASQGGSSRQFRIDGTSASVNYLNVSGSGTGSAPALSALGTDTNIDLTLTPKGTGNVRFGTYTGTILTPTGYVEIKDSGGTVRRLLVG
jgi:hypothetical protein